MRYRFALWFHGGGFHLLAVLFGRLFYCLLNFAISDRFKSSTIAM